MSMLPTPVEITPQRLNWLADETVHCEPVSASKFPANRETNRDFCEFGPNSAIRASNRAASSMPCSQIPYATETGNYFHETGNYVRRTGNFSGPSRERS